VTRRYRSKHQHPMHKPRYKDKGHYGHMKKGMHAYGGYGHATPVEGWCCRHWLRMTPCGRPWHPSCCYWGFHPAEVWCCQEWAWEIPGEYEMCYPHYKGDHAKPKKGEYSREYQEECLEEGEKECCKESEDSCECQHPERRPDRSECSQEQKEECHGEAYENVCEEEEPERE